MDKHQNYLLKKISAKSYNEDGSVMMEEYVPNSRSVGFTGYGNNKPSVRRVTYTLINGIITIKQDSDITKTRYYLDISGSVINKVCIVKNGQMFQVLGYPRTDEPYGCETAGTAVGGKNAGRVTMSAASSRMNDDIMFRLNNSDVNRVTENEKIPPEKRKDTIFRLMFDFTDPDRISLIKIYFVNNLADPVDIEVDYLEADKEKYYAQKEKERKEDIAKNVAVSCNTGADLVNIYFNACSSDYSCSEIELFICVNPKVTGWRKIKQCKVPEGEFFVSVGGLAYGKYSFILHQYDKKGTIIFDSERIVFSIERPSYGSGRPVNVIC